MTYLCQVCLHSGSMAGSGNGRKLWRPWDGCAHASWCLHLSFARNGLIRSNGKIYYITKNMTCVYVYIYMTWVSSIEIWECSHAGTCFFAGYLRLTTLIHIKNVWLMSGSSQNYGESWIIHAEKRMRKSTVNPPVQPFCSPRHPFSDARNVDLKWPRETEFSRIAVSGMQHDSTLPKVTQRMFIDGYPLVI